MPAPTDALRVRAYNVRFGDALLVSLPDIDAQGKLKVRHILVDVGNVLMGSGGEDDVFSPVLDNIVAELDGNPLDLYVMTHEHMDHVQGLLWAKRKKNLELEVSHAWLTASAEPGYYDRFPDAKKKRLAFEEEYRRVALFLQAAAEEPGRYARALLANNNPRKTSDCVDYLRGLAQETSYVHREFSLAGSHPFHEARFQVWAPEEDTSSYYGSFVPLALHVDGNSKGEPESRLARPLPPPGVDGEAFYHLVERRRGGVLDNLLTIDKAANDSSIVFSIEWRGWRLLFPGDAEERSWREMGKRGVLSPVHFLKVGHHGSHNGTPAGELLEAILPQPAPGPCPRRALVSTHEGTYSGVPHEPTLDELSRRCGQPVVRVGADDDPVWVDLLFPGGSGG